MVSAILPNLPARPAHAAIAGSLLGSIKKRLVTINTTAPPSPVGLFVGTLAELQTLAHLTIKKSPGIRGHQRTEFVNFLKSFLIPQ
jgi:hypothetical protein